MNGKVKGIYQEASAKFGFAEWNLDAATEYEAFIEKIIREGIELATKEYECHAWFPIEWAFGEDPSDGVGGKPPDDPTTIYVELPLGPDEDEHPRWSFTLAALVDNMIEGAECGGENGSPITVDHHQNFRSVSDGLRAQADKIDAALKRHS